MLQEFEIPSEASLEGALQNESTAEKIRFFSAKIWPEIFIFETPCISISKRSKIWSFEEQMREISTYLVDFLKSYL